MFFSGNGILGQNARNLKYIRGDNFLEAKRLADSKLATKNFLASQKIAVPATLHIFKKLEDITLEKIGQLEAPFVVKPNNGYGGNGIIVIDEKNAEGNFVTNTGETYTLKAMRSHLEYILDGFYSLSGMRDKAVIEKKVILTEDIELLGKYGLPDVRVVVYNTVPVMAMIRIPTAESGGKANLHGGACAAGIDIGSGKLTYISKKGRTITSVPGMGDVRGITIPEWDKVLALAVSVQYKTGINFLGCDVVLDKDDGPLLLEMNIRPGLEIQNVNHAALKDRLERVEGLEVNSVEKGVRLGRDLFSGEIEERILNLSGKKVAGTREYFKIFQDEKEYQYVASLRVSDTESYIDRAFLHEVLKIDSGEKTRVKIDGEILGIKKHLGLKIADLEDEKIILGRNALRGMLLDPFKYKKGEGPVLANLESLNQKNVAITGAYEKQLRDLDIKIMNIDKQLLVLKYITPTNLQEEKESFIEKQGDYIPNFTYQELPFDPTKLLIDLQKIEIPDIPYSIIFQRKKEEVENKLRFFIAFVSQNTGDMTLYSKKIFGKIDEENFIKAKEIIDGRDQITLEKEFLGETEVREYIKKFNHIYHTKIKVKVENITARFTMKGDILLMRKGAQVGKKEIRSIIAHEIEGHYLRKINGKLSGLNIMRRGGARYIETDEGIAIYNQNRFLGVEDRKYYGIYERYYFLQYALKHSYRRLMKYLLEFYDGDYERVFSYMLRIKRGFEDPTRDGACMKDVVYVNGITSLEMYLAKGGSLEELYIGKLHIDDIAEIAGKNIFTQHKKDIQIPFSA